MDQTEIIDSVHNYAEVVMEKFGYKKLILFGSYAKGNFHVDSDIAIDFDMRFERQVGLMRLTHGIDSRIEPHPFRERDFEVSDPLVYEIMKCGKEIKKEWFKVGCLSTSNAPACR